MNKEQWDQLKPGSIIRNAKSGRLRTVLKIGNAGGIYLTKVSGRGTTCYCTGDKNLWEPTGFIIRSKPIENEKFKTAKMNREIKFRVWDKVDYMSSPFTLSEPKAHKIEFTDDCPIMQFTGLKDKNGKEIYEGDILHCYEYDSSDTGKRITQTFTNAVVGIEKGNSYYYPKGNMNQPHQLLMYAYKPEVIGNIYQNPELIRL